jgi:putative ABC transport system ATP-binding protein
VITAETVVAAACERMIRLRDGRVIEDLSLAGGETPEATLSRVSGLRLA